MVSILNKNLLWSNQYELILLANPSTLLFDGHTEFISWNVEYMCLCSYLEEVTMRQFKGQM